MFVFFVLPVAGHDYAQAWLEVLPPSENVGIGTTNPLEKMQIGNVYTFYSDQFDNAIGRNYHYDGTQFLRINSEPSGAIFFGREAANGGGVAIMSAAEGPANSPIEWNRGITVKSNGKVYIGENDISAESPYIGQYQFAVDGMIISKRARVSAASWADDVLKEDYPLMTLPEVDAFIGTNGHLPGMPAEKEIVTNGIDLGDMAKLQQIKIEELVRYAIEQDNRIDELEKELKVLKNQK